MAGLVYWLKFSPVPVTEHQVAQDEIVAEVMGTGTLEAHFKSTISPRIAGRLQKVLVDQGDVVKSGQLLVRLDEVWLWLAPPDERLVLGPTLAILFIVITFWALLWNRDGALPLLDIGSYYMIALAAYFLVPLLGYLLSGMTYTVLSYERLYLLNPTPEEIGGFAWRMVAYTFCFAVTYLTIRGDSVARNVPVASPTRATVRAFVILVAIFFGIFQLLRIHYGLLPRPAYDSSLYDAYEAYLSLPLFGQQIVNTIDGIWFVIKLGLVVILVVHWKDWRCRLVLFSWLLFLILMGILQMGGRAEFFFLILAAGFLYHRHVKPLSAATRFACGHPNCRSILCVWDNAWGARSSYQLAKPAGFSFGWRIWFLRH